MYLSLFVIIDEDVEIVILDRHLISTPSRHL